MPLSTDTLARLSDVNASPRAAGVLVTTEVPQQKTAWTKARQDVQDITRAQAWDTLAMPAGLSPWEWRGFFAQLSRRLGEGGSVLVEYPFEQRRRIYPLFTWCRLRGVRLHGLIHDLHTLRFGAAQGREVAILRLFDGLISHNPVMTEWLRAAGLSKPLVDLHLFDYLLQAPQPATWHAEALSAPLKVLCAGNLSHPKARYIYDPRLGELSGVELSLYGAFFEPERMPASPVRYKGVFEADAPVLDGRYHFGLVWDGESAQGVEGHYGHYMRYNNPHKVSLYMALGLPVVVWQEAAVARFVLDQGVGVAIADLRELGQVATRLNPAAYARMTAQVRRVRTQVMQGHFLSQALQALQEA